MSLQPDSTQVRSATKTRLLVVDDEPTLRLGFAYALTNPATVAETAANGAEALQFLEERCYDAMVLDLRMPEIDGLAVIEEMRRRGNTTPVVLCSAYITLHSAVAAIHHHVVDFLMKPVKPTELRSAIASVVEEADDCVLARALGQVRKGRISQGVEILRGAKPAPGTREDSWLRILSTMNDNPGDLEKIESELTDNILGQLAYKLD